MLGVYRQQHNRIKYWFGAKLNFRRNNMNNRIVEIWIRGRKLCEITEDNEAIECLEQIVRKAGYSIIEKEEEGKIIKMI